MEKKYNQEKNLYKKLDLRINRDVLKLAQTPQL